MVPEIRKNDGVWNLFAEGKPFTMLCGEIHNSSASDVYYMEAQVWPRLRELHMNSILFPVYWEMIEKKEGEFDFSVLDQIVIQAQHEEMKVGILWFGLWKNGISSYVPEWVKTDIKRFVRVKDCFGKPMEVITPFCKEAVEADAKAFYKLMEHIKELNTIKETVILIQVENEVGLLGSDRDYSTLAQEAFEKEIPVKISQLYGIFGTWEQAFGEDAPEVFMEYAYALAIEQIAKKGKEVYPIPMCVNAWLEKFPWRPGGYPSGGPIARYIPLWKVVAPSIDVFAPDVYTSDFIRVCREYQGEDNPLFILEHRRDIKSISHLFYAIGACSAICFSPFGIEDFLMAPEERKGVGNPQVMSMLNIDRSAWECEKTGNFLKKAYEILEPTMEVINKFKGEGNVYGFLRADEHEKGTVVCLETCDVRIDYIDQKPETPKAAGIIIETGKQEVYLIGVNFRFSLLPKKNVKKEIGILEYSEGRIIEGEFRRGRILNGDERYCMMIMEEPELQCIKWYFFE